MEFDLRHKVHTQELVTFLRYGRLCFAYYFRTNNHYKVDLMILVLAEIFANFYHLTNSVIVIMS